jgi:hypothetical protein
MVFKMFEWLTVVMFHLCLEISISSNSCNLFQFLIVQLLYIVNEKEGKPDIKPYTLPYGLGDLYRNLMSEISLDYVHKPQQNCTFMNSASVGILRNKEQENKRYIQMGDFFRHLI